MDENGYVSWTEYSRHCYLTKKDCDTCPAKILIERAESISECGVPKMVAQLVANGATKWLEREAGDRFNDELILKLVRDNPGRPTSVYSASVGKQVNKTLLRLKNKGKLFSEKTKIPQAFGEFIRNQHVLLWYPEETERQLKLL